MRRFCGRAIALVLVMMALMPAMARADEGQKREMRTVWIATVSNIDWPKTVGTGATVIAKQKKELLDMLDGFQRSNMNSVILQVRPMADAFYRSSYEPWTRYLTGTRGLDPGWDPLEFAVEECHKRGLELHAWVNPYRFSTNSGNGQNTAIDQEIKASGVLIKNGDYVTFNPALESSIQRVVNVCREMIENYDIDGIIFDDYFYPNGGLTTGTDAPDYEMWQNSGTSLSLADWRRANVNRMVHDVYAMVQETKPYVKFGIGPAGVAGTAKTSAGKHGVDPCPVGSDWQYNTIFSDPLAWLEEGTIDYISPQLYWKTTHSTNPFGPLTQWWSYIAHHYGRHHYASHNIYFMADTNTQEDWDEILTQIGLSRQYNL
ncbi:MAG: family 10 glycosylhydrolase, partial [Muribaculaceae bacterium]|nr:family 10 glycosylhydrolase [Muribaculaceae bacterium]